jgi:hypothetical protein
MVLRQSPTSGEWSGHKYETPEGRSCEVTRTVDIGILRDIPWPLDLFQVQPDIDHSGSKEVVTPQIP